MTFRYRVFGLEIESTFRLPELVDGSRGSIPDIVVKTGVLPPATGEYEFEVEGNTATLWVPQANATFRMIDGRDVTVHAGSGSVEREQRLFLLGSALGAVLHQRSLLPLHACAMELDGKAVAFLGRSGAGKSTLAAWLADHGCKLLSDDVCVVDQKHSGATVFVGIPRLRLWRDALEARGEVADDHVRSFADLDKYDVLGCPCAEHDRFPLAALFHLTEGQALEVIPLRGAQAVECLLSNTYRGSYVKLLNKTSAHFEQCIELARKVPISQVVRPKGFSRIDQDYSCILEQIHQMIN